MFLDGYDSSSSASGGATNPDVLLSSDLSLTLKSNDDDAIITQATVYSSQDCSGESSLVMLLADIDGD